MTNNEARVAHRILQKHGIKHRLSGHCLPLTSDEFAVGIADSWFHDFADVRKYVKLAAGRYKDAEIDLLSWQAAAEIAEAVRRDANQG
jgi:hypothetical protein